MTAHAKTFELRLVGEARPSREAAARDIAAEMRAAASAPALDPNDPRLALASKTQAMLQGPALSPDRRQQLLDFAHDLGMRPFDANLVIAIVQDQARQDEATRKDAPTPVGERLRIVGGPASPTVASTRSAPERHATLALATSVVAAAAATAWLVLWLLGG